MSERTPLPGHEWVAAIIRDRIVVDRAGCWLWQRCIQSGGYGQFDRLRTRATYGTRYVHRIAYMAWKGRIPDGLEIDHLCRVRHCCNPEHLEAVTRAVNNYRGTSPTAQQARVETCPKGHPYDEENTYIRPDRSQRGCKRCRTESSRQVSASLPKVYSGTPVSGRESLFPRTAESCNRDHPMTEVNTYVDPKGRAHCRECRSLAWNRYKMRSSLIEQTAA